jgi:N-acyl-D-aspartate/D-glutamate deacylase
MYRFERGITHLYDKLKLYHEIVAYHIEHAQVAAIVAACIKYGEKCPQLWIQALAYFAAQTEPYEEQIQTVLRAISDRALLPPLMILQMLSQNPTKHLSVVKEYIISSLQQENDLIRADEEEIQRFQMETQHMREEIQRLHTQSVIKAMRSERGRGMHAHASKGCYCYHAQVLIMLIDCFVLVSSAGRSPSKV